MESGFSAYVAVKHNFISLLFSFYHVYYHDFVVIWGFGFNMCRYRGI